MKGKISRLAFILALASATWVTLAVLAACTITGVALPPSTSLPSPSPGGFSTATSAMPEVIALATFAPPPTFARPTRSPYDLSMFVDADPAEIDNKSLPITPLSEINTTGRPQVVDISTYRLRLEGQVEQPLSLTYDEILALPVHTEVALLICPGVFVDNAQWGGVPLSVLIGIAKPKAGSTIINLYAIDEYRESITLDFAQKEGVFLAHTVDGVRLPPEHGFPLRLVQRGVLGGRWLKWVSRIEVL